MDPEIRGTIRRWGNSYALRLRREDVKRLHLREGQSITARLVEHPTRIDLGEIPTFRGGRTMTRAEREKWAGEGHWMNLQEKLRRSRA